MVMKRVPSFSSRPGFPNGLKVLLLEPDVKHRTYVESLLQQCSYQVSSCTSAPELLSVLQSHNTYDVVLAELQALNDKGNSILVNEHLKAAPLVLMSETPSTEDILSGVRLGAVEVLEKPLSQTKLRTLWQHTVRKMMSSLSFMPSAHMHNDEVTGGAEEPSSCSPARSGMSNSSSGRRDTEVDTEHSSLSHVADPVFGSEDMPSLVRASSITSSRSCSPDLRKRKSMDGLENPRSKASREAATASLAAYAAVAAAQAAPQQHPAAAGGRAAVAATTSSPTTSSMLPVPPQLPNMMPMLPNGFRPPSLPGPLPAGMVWGLPMPPPGLMFPPGFIPPPFPAGFPIPPTILQGCFPPMCPPGAMAAPPCTAPIMTSAPMAACSMPISGPTLTSAPQPNPPCLSIPTSSSSTAPPSPPALPPLKDPLSFDSPTPPGPALHPSPSLVSLDVAESEDLDKHSLGPVPVEMTGDSLADLPHLDGMGDNPALLFSDWLLDGDDMEASDAAILGLQLKKSDSLVDLINDSLCCSIATAV